MTFLKLRRPGSSMCNADVLARALAIFEADHSSSALLTIADGPRRSAPSHGACRYPPATAAPSGNASFRPDAGAAKTRRHVAHRLPHSTRARHPIRA
jgi:hypothetical protein